MINFFERGKKNLKYLSLPQPKIRDIKDRITRIDEELEQVIIGLDMLIDKMNVLIDSLKGIPTPPAKPITVPGREIIIREKEREYLTIPKEIIKTYEKTIIPKIVDYPVLFRTVPPKMLLIGTKKYEINASEETYHNFNDYTDVAILTIYDDNVYLDFRNISEDSMLYPAGSLITIYRHPQYDRLYMKAETSSARIYISEWRVDK